MQTQINKSETINYILFVILKRKFLLITVVSATFLSIIFFTFLVTPTWEAITVILIDRSSKQSLSIFKDVNIPVGEAPSAGSEALEFLPLLAGENMAYDIAKEFGLDERAKRQRFHPKGVRERAKNIIVDIMLSPVTLMKGLGILKKGEKDWLDASAEDFLEDWVNIETEEGASVIDITINGETRKLAMDIANRMVELLRERTQAFTREGASNTYVFVKNQLLVVEENMRKAEIELANYKKENSIVMLEEEKKLKVSKLENLESELASIEQLLTALFIERQETHPEVQILMAKKDHMNSLIREHKNELRTIPEKELDLADLQEKLAINTSIYQTLKAKKEELEIEKESVVNEYHIRVLDKAYISPSASYDWPSWSLVIIAAIIFSFTFGFGTVFIAEFLNDSITSTHDIERHLSLACLGIIPEYGRKLR